MSTTMRRVTGAGRRWRDVGGRPRARRPRHLEAEQLRRAHAWLLHAVDELEATRFPVLALAYYVERIAQGDRDPRLIEAVQRRIRELRTAGLPALNDLRLIANVTCDGLQGQLPLSMDA
jgi:hypothetical protein